MRRLRFATPFVLVLATAQLAPAQTSNPPPPAKPAPPAPPPPVTARIVMIDVVDDGTMVAIPLGTADGVGRTWKARAIDVRGKPVANGDLDIVRIDRHVTRLKSKLTSDQLETLRVQLQP